MRSSKKILSILLMTTVLATALPTMVKADDSKPAITNTEGTSQAAKQEEAVPKIVGEINDKREENIKQFLMDDNSYEAVIYNEPVHYYEDGQWKDIDNTLQDAEDDELASDTDNSDDGDNSQTSPKAETAQSSSKQEDKNALTNTSNSFKVSFSKNTKKKKLVSLKKDKYEISWGLDNSNKAASSKILEKDSKKLEESMKAEADKKISSDKKISTLSADKKAKAKENIMDNSEKETVEKNSSSVQYSNIYTDTDLRYDLIGDKVKENIVIN
ncbi:hypothetical protein IAI10_24420, partial [Clostridium sp. 19966]|uniref:hypothetical protein n=1 Tax=Clostridium sp. 19966 TaxID=2768166 RepID=UPI0028DFF4BA